MKNALTIFLFTLAVTLSYNYVGQLVPQKEVYPPKDVSVRSDMNTEEMVEAGKIIVEGKGTCLTCHNTSARFPNLEGMGARAASQKPGMNELDYLAEALYEPNSFIVEPFAPGMPAVNKPPIGLSDQEVLTVIAYLQSLGGKPSVTMNTKLKYQGQAAAVVTEETADSASKEPVKDLSAEDLLANYGCLACHSIKDSMRLVGPSLFDIGARLSRAEIYQAIIEPDAVISEGYPPAVMNGTLVGNGFYQKVNSAQLKLLTDYLAGLKGGS